MKKIKSEITHEQEVSITHNPPVDKLIKNIKHNLKNTAPTVIYYCKKCGKPMVMFGVTERGGYKYCCNDCHIIEIKNPENKRK